jgi:hypothetical protein
MFGLNTDPLTNQSYASIDYAWYCLHTGALQIWESGVNQGTFGTYTTSTVLHISYEGSTIKYWADGVVIRTVATTAGRTFYFDSSFYDVGGSLSAIEFGPTLDNNYRAHDPSKLDLTRWLEWADYCDDLVPDGNGGTEKRLTWDGSFDSSQAMWDAALTVAALGRATPYWRGNTITVAIDKASTSAFLISVGNIGLDSFEEVFLNLDGRAGSVEADFLNLDADLTRDKITVVNYDAPDDWGAATAALQGEIRPSGAYRHCKFKLARTQALTRLVTVSMSTDPIAFTLGDVGNVQHDVPRWGEGGRLVAATTTSVTLDKEVTIEADTTYAVMVRYLDNTVAERTINNAAGVATVLTFSTPLSATPDVYDIWAFGEVGTYVKPMRVIGITPNGDLKRTIVLEDYNASLYTIDDNLPLLQTYNYSRVVALESVANLVLSERLVLSNAALTTFLVVIWDRPSIAGTTQRLEILAGQAGQSLTSKAIVYPTTNSFEIPVIDGQTWQVVVRASNGVQWESIPAAPSATKTIVGKLAVPEDVENLRSAPTTFGGLILTWDAVADLDISYYALRYSSLLTGATWENSVELANINATTTTIPAALDGSYLVKAHDTGGRESVNAAMLVTAIPSLITFNAVEEVNDGVTWPGTKTDTYTADNKLYLDMAGVWEDIPDFDAIANIDGYGGVLSEGFYECAEIVNLGAVQTARCGMSVDFAGIDTSALWDDILDFDAVVELNGLVPGVGVQPQIAISDDDITYSDWSAFVAGDYTAQYFKFRLRLYTDSLTNYPEVTQFVVSVDMPDRAERAKNVSIDAAGTAITFGQEYMTPPIVRATINDAVSGDTYKTTSVAETGFTIQILNGGVGVARSVDWQSVGY